MSTVFSKNKEKRTRTSSGESNNSSFVKNVTSRMSGLLPATITKWFSSPSSSTNGSAPTADATDSSTEDEAPESPITTQPPAKRMRYSTASGYNSTDANCVTSNIETIETSTPYTVQSPPGRTTFRRETNFVSTPIRPDETTVERTTIDRTLIDRTTIDRTVERIVDKDATSSYSQTATSIGLSASKKRKSLFGNQSQEISEASKKACVKTSNNTLRDPRQPTFKPTLLGSPFYAGRTTYGGAASSYINQPNISQRQNTTVNEAPSTSDNNMSTSARRILELLESYSSPLMDAKRIPHYTRPTRQEVMKRHSESSTSSSPYAKTNSYKTQELHVPSIASILRLKQRSRLNDSTNAARQLIASHSSSSPDYSPYPSTSTRDQTDGNNKLTTKVKSRLTRQNRGEALESETMTPVELPKAVLQIDPNNLPNFSIPILSKPSSIEKPTLTTPFALAASDSKIANVVEKSKSDSKASNSIYNFAHPVRITSESPKTTSTPPKFTFGSPERSIDKPVSSVKSSDPFKLVGASKDSEKKTETTPAAVDWNCPDCWVKNKSDVSQCVCCGHKRQAAAAAPAKCSVCKLADSQPAGDKCVNCAKVQLNNVSKPLKADTSAKWSCKDCWVSNDNSADKCVCCGAANPKKETTQTVPVQKSEAGGMCSKCFSTKNSDGTCSKCAETKTDNSFKITLKSQANKWECEQCLVRNDSDKTKCVCCEAERAGAPKAPEKKQFNFGTVNTTFKFGIDPKVQEANLAKAAEKPIETKDKVEESETNNNVLAKAPPMFSFGIPSQKPADLPDAPKEKVAELPKPTFSFGLPKQNSVSSVPSVFGIPNKSTEASKEAEKKDVPGEKEKPVVNEKTEETKKDEPAKVPVMMFGRASALADKLTSGQPASVLPAATSASSAPAPILTFSAVSTEKTGLFGALTSSAPPAGVSFAPPATASSALSMFQKTDEPKPVNKLFDKSGTTAVPSLFAKSDAPATAASMFSFGSSQPAPPTEKPSFNFSFGSSNKTDMFKPPTFTATDSSTSVNKFTLGTAATENPLAPNPLTGGTGLVTSTMTSNSLGGNGLAVNPLAVAANLTGGSGLQSGMPAAPPNIFGSAVPKDNVWSPPSNSTPSLFGANAPTNSAPKPFSFGSSTSSPFNTNPPAFGASSTQTSTTAFGVSGTQTATPAFGASGTQTSAPAFGGLATSPPSFGAPAQPAAAPAFGASQATPAPAFGSNMQSTPSIFGMANQNSQPSMFSTPNQNASGMFGSPQQPAAGSMQPPAMGMFGRPNVAATPTFGTPNPSIPTFEAPSLPAQAPSFNFGTPQTSFVFGQQQQQQQPAMGGQTGVYSFGAAGGQTQVQFSMGSAPNQNVRRVRRATRRSSQPRAHT